MTTQTLTKHGKVDKIPVFQGSLPERALYVYTPPDYETDVKRFYPVIYMHDGQNIFEHYVQDSYAGSWRADETADWLILAGKMQAVIIVGVSNGHQERMAEYLPPYSSYAFHAPNAADNAPAVFSFTGKADATFKYYRDEVTPFIKSRFRVREGRDHTATIGSSMGGLFSTYIAWEYPEFARLHAAMSPSYWITNDGSGHLEVLERIRHYPKRDLRLWLDSGEGRSRIPGKDDDNKYVTREARDVLRQSGYHKGLDYEYHLARRARHNEVSWAARLHLVFQFLFPA